MLIACLSLLLAQAPAPTAPQQAAPLQPPFDTGVAFPGQWAPPAIDVKFPVWPKGCDRFVNPPEKLACLEYVASDWGRLSRHAPANAALGPARKGDRRVVFFGDSITDAWSKPGMGGFFPGKPYLNRGIGGQTTGQMLVRFRQDVLDVNPRAVVILAGTNDLAGNAGAVTPEIIQGNLMSMAELAKARGIRVALAALLPVCDCALGQDGKPRRWTDGRPPERIQALNAWIAAYARRNGHAFVDYHAAMADGSGMLKAALTHDGLHPNAAGYAVMAPLAEKAVARLLGR